MPAARYWDGTKWADLSLGTLGGQYVSFIIGDGAATSFTLIHRLGSRNVVVACYRNTTPFDEVEVDVERTDLDTITVRTFPTVPAVGEFTVVVSAPGTQAALNITMDVWHTVGTPGEPAYQGTFTTGAIAAGFRKYPDGRVRLRGHVTGSGTGTVFYLPPGYRPVATKVVAIPTSNAALTGYAQVAPDGAVFVNVNVSAGTQSYLDGIEFDTEAVLQTASVAAQPLDAWHIIGNPGEPAFQGGWASYDNGATYTLPGFRKDPTGRVALKGLIKNGTIAGPIFTLPVGYRPTKELLFAPSNNSNATTDVRVRPDGTVYCQVGANTWLTLDSIEFDTESVAAYATGSFPYLPVTMDPWHQVGASGEPAFQSGWFNYGQGWTPLRFRKSPDGTVRVVGMLGAGTFQVATIFTLPVGYRPVYNHRMYSRASPGSSGNDIINAVDVMTDGRILMQTGGTANPAVYNWLDIEFDTETVLQTASVTAQPLDAMHLVGAAGEPAFQNSWVNYGGAEQVAAFRKDPLGRVEVFGIVKNGTVGQAIFTLPPGCRPPAAVRFPVLSNDVLGYGRVNADGTVVLQAGGGASNAYVDLSPLQFDTQGASAYTTGLIPAVTAVPPAVKDYGSGGATAAVPVGGWAATETGGGVISHVITPQVDCWWPTSCNCMARVLDASWQRLEVRLFLSPADVDGNISASGSILHNSGAADWNECHVTRAFKLAKGITYTLTMSLYVIGGTWNVFRHPSHMWLAHDGIRPR